MQPTLPPEPLQAEAAPNPSPWNMEPGVVNQMRDFLRSRGLGKKNVRNAMQNFLQGNGLGAAAGFLGGDLGGLYDAAPGILKGYEPQQLLDRAREEYANQTGLRPTIMEDRVSPATREAASSGDPNQGGVVPGEKRKRQRPPASEPSEPKPRPGSKRARELARERG